LHYDRYLREVIDFLENDPHFRDKLHNTDMEDIKVLQHFIFQFDFAEVKSDLNTMLLTSHSLFGENSKGSWLKSWTLSAIT